MAIVLKNADKAAAEMVWSRIIAKLDIINQADGRKFIISGSHGIVSTDEKLPAGIDEILALADSRMYEEKRLIKQKLKSVLL